MKFCSKPFEYIEIFGNGDVYVCCNNWLPKTIGNIFQSSMKEIWNSSSAIEIRKSILDDSFRYCNQNCPYLTSGLVDKESPLQIVEDVSDKNVVVDYPKWINLCYDRSCNLACPSCRKDFINVREGAEHVRLNSIQDKIMDYASEAKPDWLYVTGSGDCFASKLFKQLLTNLVPWNNLKLYLHTNGMLFNERTWSQLSHIHSNISWVHVSIDAASDSSYKKNRIGGNWDILNRNLKYISELKNQGSIETFEISFVVQKNNWSEMKDFVALGESLNVDRVLFSPLGDWGTFEKQDYKERCVHLREHPDHFKMIDFLRDPVFKKEIVRLGAFRGLLKDSLKC